MLCHQLPADVPPGTLWSCGQCLLTREEGWDIRTRMHHRITGQRRYAGARRHRGSGPKGPLGSGRASAASHLSADVFATIMTCLHTHSVGEHSRL
jgi:hypothetical protein